ncbi:MAG: nucleotide exchange factor GrpE [Ruminococcaceae bacterium]|nr:nucleotide exchange factor GrpE [Oscillospiraceae bacterium]
MAENEKPMGEETVEKAAGESTEKNEEPKESKGKKPTKKELDELKKENERLQAELAEQNDRYLRMVAEYDNFRKRSAKEKESVYTDATFDALKEMLPIIDNLERAEAFLKEDDQLSEGVRMTLAQVKMTLERLGVEPVSEAGVPFDPMIHNAVMHNEDEAFGENTVSMVLQKGYKKGDKVVRYAMVQVSN